MYECFACTYVYVQCTCLVPTEARMEVASTGAVVTDSCEPHCGLWESNPGHLQKQVPSTVEPSLQPQMKTFGVVAWSMS